MVRWAIWLMVLELLVAASGVPRLGARQAEDGQAVELKVMTFNVWIGGAQVDFAQVVEAIRAAEADVVGLQEVEGQARRLAEALGWAYVDERLQVISRYPLIDPPGAAGLYTFVEPRPGRVIALANLHLPADPYGPEAVRDGHSLEEVVALEEETRLPALARHLAELPELMANGIPVVMTGDLNSPSHLDWTAAAVEMRAGVRFDMAWPVGAALAEAGFRDSYREAHPNPVLQPGLTWTPGYPPPHLRPDETHDRIDWVLVGGDIATLDSRLVGEAAGPDVEVAVSPWPSDHRAVVSTLRVTSVEPPLLVAVDLRAVTAGDEVVVRFHAPGEEGDRIAVVPAGGDAASDAVMSLPPRESAVDGSVVFGTGTLAPGEYAAVLVGAAGEEVARIPFWVLAAGARPTLTVDRPVYAVGELIGVSWANAPGNRWDWVGVYGRDDPDLDNYWTYLYTDATIAGSVVFDEAAFGEPLPPGDYEMRLLRDDGYVVLAEAGFSVAE